MATTSDTSHDPLVKRVGPAKREVQLNMRHVVG